MPLFAFGINHHTAPLAVREQLVFQPTDIGRALHTLLRVPDVSEAAILSTCNRTEVYCSLATGATVAPLSDWLARHHGLTSEYLNATCTSIRNKPPFGICFALPAGLIPWSWASHKFSGK